MFVKEKTTTSAKALDFIRRPHPGHKGRGFHPKKGGPASSSIFFGAHRMDRTSLHAKIKSVWNNETKPGANG
jgi:hypothetical protein